jgi:hypothetical protein
MFCVLYAVRRTYFCLCEQYVIFPSWKVTLLARIVMSTWQILIECVYSVPNTSCDLYLLMPEGNFPRFSPTENVEMTIAISWKQLRLWLNVTVHVDDIMITSLWHTLLSCNNVTVHVDDIMITSLWHTLLSCNNVTVHVVDIMITSLWHTLLSCNNLRSMLST